MNNLPHYWFLMKHDFSLSQAAQFDTSSNLFCFAFTSHPIRLFRNKLFIEKNFSWVLYKPIKALEIKFLLITQSYPISFFFWWLNYTYLIPSVNAQILYPAKKLSIPIGTPTTEAKTKIEAHAVTAETKTRKYLK